MKKILLLFQVMIVIIALLVACSSNQEASTVKERSLEGRVTEIIFAGSVYKTVVTLSSGKEIIAIDSNQSDQAYEIGEKVYLIWNQEKAAVLAS